MEGPAEDTVGGGAEGYWEMEEPVEDPGPPGGREVWAGGTGLPLHHGCWKVVPGEEEDAVSAVSELEVWEWLDEQGAGVEEAGTGGTPLFLLTPDFMAPAGTV